MRPVARIVPPIAAIVALFGCEGPTRAPDPAPGGIGAALEADSCGLGDPVRLRVSADLPPGARLDFPAGLDSIDGWVLLDAGPIRERRGSGGRVLWSREMTIAGYRIGFLGPDSIRVSAVSGAGDTLRLSGPAPSLFIGGQIPSQAAVDPSSMRDIRGMLGTGRGWIAWLIAGGGAALAGAALLLLVRRRRRPRSESTPAIPSISPEEEFEAAIARLIASGLLERGLYREFYYEVSRAVRLFLERVSGLPLLESTSEEVRALMAPRLRGSDAPRALHEWLREGDLVKYARMERLQAEALDYLDRSRRLVGILAAPESAGDAREATG